MGGTPSTNTKTGSGNSNHNAQEYYSDHEIMDLINRMMINNNDELTVDTLNFNQANTEAMTLVGGGKAHPTKNRYDKYNLSLVGGSIDSDQYTELNSEVADFSSLKNRLETELTRANQILTGGGCGCEDGNSNIAVLSGGAKKKKDSDDEADELDEEDEDLLDELDDDIDELTDEDDDEKQARSSTEKRHNRTKPKSKSKSKPKKLHHSEYSATNSNSSTINIVPFYSTPSDSEYYTHLRNKGRFS